jgi:hypothetical protein
MLTEFLPEALWTEMIEGVVGQLLTCHPSAESCGSRGRIQFFSRHLPRNKDLNRNAYGSDKSPRSREADLSERQSKPTDSNGTSCGIHDGSSCAVRHTLDHSKHPGGGPHASRARFSQFACTEDNLCLTAGTNSVTQRILALVDGRFAKDRRSALDCQGTPR